MSLGSVTVCDIRLTHPRIDVHVREGRWGDVARLLVQDIPVDGFPDEARRRPCDIKQWNKGVNSDVNDD